MNTPRRSRWKKLLWVLAVPLLVGAALAWRERPVEVTLIEVDAGPVRVEAVGVGTVESEVVVSVSFTTPGRVLSLTAMEGQSVRAGDVLATLDVEAAHRQKVVTEASVDVASASVARAGAELERARAADDVAKLELRRLLELVEAGAATQSSLDAARERALRTTAELDAARAVVAERRGAVTVARETVAAQQHFVDDGVLRSPLDGVVVRRHREVGDVVGVGAPVFAIASTRKVWARVWVDETALPRLREGADAEVLLRGDEGRPLRARLDRVAPEADRKTHEVLVDLELLERPARLVFGQRAEARVVLAEQAAVARAPRAACDVVGSRCWAERDGRIAEVPVRLGLVGGEFVAIEGGLQAGDRIIDRSVVTKDPPLGRRVARSSR
jgi:HlyD family secretion protein